MIKSIIKLAALCSSLLLMGGCVSYRAGFLDKLWGDSDPPAPKYIPVKREGSENEDSKEGKFEVFGGTKRPIGNSIFVSPPEGFK
jgi:hypothetical protein